MTEWNVHDLVNNQNVGSCGTEQSTLKVGGKLRNLWSERITITFLKNDCNIIGLDE